MQNKYIYYKENDYELYKGKMQDVLSTFEPNSIDNIICDPPYELNFMGKGWDNSGVAFDIETWKHCFNVLKEGGYLLAFGGSRTYHRICCAIEDAGFEIRDCIMYLYGSGFPKSFDLGLAIDKHNGIDNRTGEIVKGMGTVSEITTKGGYKTNYEERLCQNEWSGWGTCLKPAYEPIIVARKPFKCSLVENIIKNRIGGLNINDCRIENSNLDAYDLEKRKESNPSIVYGDGRFLDGLHKVGVKHGVTDLGRFPANVILTYDKTDFEEVCGGFPNTKTGWTDKDVTKSKDNINVDFGTRVGITGKHYNDSGNASRYFYCAKASKKDRDEGLDMFETKTKVFNGKSTESSKEIKDVEKRFTTEAKNIHPTVKPTELMQYLIRLVSPKGATILDCFMGSGSTGKAVMFENRERNMQYKFIGIEMTEEYLPIAKTRIDYAKNKYKYEEMKVENERKEKGIINIFDLLEEE